MLAGALYTYKWIAAPVALYVLDRGLRTLQTHRGVVSLLPDDHFAMRMVSPSVARLALPRVFSWSPGQYAELRIPSLSRTQWHPFTIASAPHEEHMVFFIKSGGDWTNALVDHVRAAAGDLSGDRSMDNPPPTHLDIHVRGPFGAPAQHTGQYSRVLLVAGGVGVTPFLSVAKDADRVIKEVRAADAAAAAANPRRKSVASRPSTAESSRRSVSTAAAANGKAVANEGVHSPGATTVAHLGRSIVCVRGRRQWRGCSHRGDHRSAHRGCRPARRELLGPVVGHRVPPAHVGRVGG